MNIARSPPALCDELGKPDVYICSQDSRENWLTSEALSHGHRLSLEELEISDRTELTLTLCNHTAYWSSLTAFRKESLQQLRSIHRFHQAQQKKDVLYGVPLVGAQLSTAQSYPQQQTVGEAARTQWAQELAGCAPLSSLASLVPHGYMRTKLFDMLSEQKVALPRAVWFVQVAYLNRTRPDGWDGGPKLTTRSMQCTEDALAFLDQVVPHVVSALQVTQTNGDTTSAHGSTPRVLKATSPGPTSQTLPGQEDIVLRWKYMIRLVGSLYCQGLLYIASLVAWLTAKAVSLPLSLRLDLMPLWHLMLPEISRTPPLFRQVIDTCSLLMSGHCMSSQGANGCHAVLNSGKGQQQQQQQQQQQHQKGYEDLVCSLIQLAPMAFVSLPSSSLDALAAAEQQARSKCLADRDANPLSSCSRGRNSKLWKVVADLRKVQQHLAAAVNPRVLRANDTKAMQLLDGHLESCDAAAAHAKLWKLLLALPFSLQSQQQAQHELVRLVCSWAVACPALHAAEMLTGERAQDGCPPTGPPLPGYTSLHPGKALMVLALFNYHSGKQRHVQHQPHQPADAQRHWDQGSAEQGGCAGGNGGPGGDRTPRLDLSTALFSWLDDMALARQCTGCLAAPPRGHSLVEMSGGSKPEDSAAPFTYQPRHSVSRDYKAGSTASNMLKERSLQLAVLLTEKGQLDPHTYLTSLLASGVLSNARGQQSSGACPRAAFHLQLLEELHPSLIPAAVGRPSSQLKPQSPVSACPVGLPSRKRKHDEEVPDTTTNPVSAVPSSTPSCGEQRRPAFTTPSAPPAEPAPKGGSPLSSATHSLPGLRPAPKGALLSRVCAAAGQTFPSQAQPEAVERYASLRCAVLGEHSKPCGVASLYSSADSSSSERSFPFGVPQCVARSPDLGKADEESAPRVRGSAGLPDRCPSAGTKDLSSGSEATDWFHQVQARLNHLLSLCGASPNAAVQEAEAEQGQLWADCVVDILSLRVWQRRQVAAWFHGVCKGRLRACLAIPCQPGSPAPTAAAAQLSPAWLLCVMGLLDMCGAVWEPAELLCDVAMVLLQTTAAATVEASALGPSEGGPRQLAWQAYDQFWISTGLPPQLVFRLVAAHHQQLAALGRLPRLLRMLTAGMWGIPPPPTWHRQGQRQRHDKGASPGGAAPHSKQQAQHGVQESQRELHACFQPQLRLAARLVSLQGGQGDADPGVTTPTGQAPPARSPSPAPGSQAGAEGGPSNGVALWWQEMEKQHGPQHWVLAELRGLARREAGAWSSTPQAGAGHTPWAPSGLCLSGEWGKAASWVQETVQPSQGVAWAQSSQGQQLFQQALRLIVELQDPRGRTGPGSSREVQKVERASVEGSSCQASAWAAAERLAAWVADAVAREDQDAAGQNAQRAQHRAAVAVAAVFRSCAPAAASQEPPDSTGADSADLPHLAWHTHCLCRTVLLLRRMQGAHLPDAFLLAATGAAAEAGFAKEKRRAESGASKPAALEPCQLLFLRALCCGLFPLEDVVAAAPPHLLKLVATEPDWLVGLGFGERWALLTFQRSLPAEIATHAVLAGLEGALPHGASMPSPPAQQRRWQQDEVWQQAASCVPGAVRATASRAVREACLTHCRGLQTAILRRAVSPPGSVSPAGPAMVGGGEALQGVYPPLQVALACITGASPSAGPDRGSAGALSAVLAHVEPAVLPLCWLAVRNLLDEQAYVGAVQRGESASSAVQSAARQGSSRGGGQAPLTEAEKDFTSRVLAELAARPEAAPTLAALCVDLGKELGEYLLQQLDWVLQDADSLLGQKHFSSVLMRRGALTTSPLFKTVPPATPSAPAFPSWLAAPRHFVSARSPVQDGSETGDRPHSKNPPGQQRSTASHTPVAAPFHVEQGFVQACLVCLAASSDSRRRSFAQQLVLQLQRMADLVARLPVRPTVAAKAESQVSSKCEASPSAATSGASTAFQSVPLHPTAAVGWGSRSTAQQEQPPLPTLADATPLPVLQLGQGTWGWGGRASGSRGGRPHAVQQAGVEVAYSEAGVHVGLWTRLGIIFPLLPLIYSDAVNDSAANLRSQLLAAVLRLLGNQLISGRIEWSTNDLQATSASAATKQAGEPLQSRLLHMVYALSGSSWAAWLQGGRQLKDVTPLGNTRQLVAVIESMPIPTRLKRAAIDALSSVGPLLVHLPTARSVGCAEVLSSKDLKLDPWLLLYGGRETQQRGQGSKESAMQLIPHWLQGVVRLRQRKLSYVRGSNE